MALKIKKRKKNAKIISEKKDIKKDILMILKAFLL